MIALWSGDFLPSLILTLIPVPSLYLSQQIFTWLTDSIQGSPMEPLSSGLVKADVNQSIQYECSLSQLDHVREASDKRPIAQPLTTFQPSWAPLAMSHCQQEAVAEEK